MTLFEAIILGIVEGFTEFLPISSTGHLMITSEILGLTMTDFVKSFTVYIQLGAILAVLFLYGKRFLKDKKTNLRVLTAFIPTALIGLAAYPIIKNIFLENLTVVAWALIIGGLALIIFEKWYLKRKKDSDEIKPKTAIGIGLFQALAIIPGVSRSGATIIGGLLLGINRKTIVEFSFLLAVPTMAGATFLDLYKSDFSFSSNEWLMIAVGAITAFITAIIAIKFLLNYIQKHDFTVFGWYRIAMGLILLAFILGK